MDHACVESLCDIKDSIIGAKHKVHSACKQLFLTLFNQNILILQFLSTGKATNEILLKKEHLTEY